MSSSVATSFTRASGHVLSYDPSPSHTSLFDDASDYDQDGFLDSLQRAGGPYLCSLPAFRVEIGDDYEAKASLLENNRRIQNGIIEILRRAGIGFEEIGLYGRLSRMNPEPCPVPTYVIVAKRHSSSEKWRDAAKEAYRHIATVYTGVSVEILEDELEVPLRYFSVFPTDSILVKWPQIRDAILQTLSIQDWTSLACWRYGRGQYPMENPITIIVSIRTSSTAQFHTDKQRIRGILALMEETNVSILFMKDEMEFSSGDDRLELKACSQKAKPGVSIGIHNSTAGSSTLGGFVELKFPDDDQWHRLGLTCFHCVYPPSDPPRHRVILNRIPGADKHFRHWELNPVRFGDPAAAQLLRVDQPSVHDIEETISLFERDILSTKGPRFEDVEKRIKSVGSGSEEFFVSDRERSFHESKYESLRRLESDRAHFHSFLRDGSYLLGEVVAGSGLYRVMQRGFMPQGPFIGGNLDITSIDWALISTLPERHGENQAFYPTEAPRILKSAVHLEDLKPTYDQILYKCGRSTRVTEGRYSLIRPVHITRQYGNQGQLVLRPTEEHAISSLKGGKQFSEPGDSGSFITDINGTVFGLLVAGSKSGDYSYFTHIEDVFADIKQVTGAVEVKIAEDLKDPTQWLSLKSLVGDD